MAETAYLNDVDGLVLMSTPEQFGLEGVSHKDFYIDGKLTEDLKLVVGEVRWKKDGETKAIPLNITVIHGYTVAEDMVKAHRAAEKVAEEERRKRNRGGRR